MDVLVSGTKPSSVAGTNTVLDFNNVEALAAVNGSTVFGTGLDAFAHEDYHILDANAASTYQASVAASAAGDCAGGKTGCVDTTGGSAEDRARKILEELGSAANNYTADPATDQEADQIIAYDALEQMVQEAEHNCYPEEGAYATSFSCGGANEMKCSN